MIENDHITRNVLISSGSGKLIKLTFVLSYFICIAYSPIDQQRLNELQADLI